MTLTPEEQRRLVVLNHVGSGALSGKDAAALLGLSERQLRRLRRAYEQEGAPETSWASGRDPRSLKRPSIRHAERLPCVSS